MIYECVGGRGGRSRRKKREREKRGEETRASWSIARFCKGVRSEVDEGCVFVCTG